MSDVSSTVQKIVELFARALDAPQKSDEWMTARHNIITSSEVASVLDCNMYESSLDLLKRKSAPIRKSFTGMSIEWGERYEPIAIDVFKQIKKQNVSGVNLVVSDKYTWLGASPDGVVTDGRLLEIKCPFSRKIINGKTPYCYWIQVQIQLEVCNLEECHFMQCEFAENPMNFTGMCEVNGCKMTGTHSDGTRWILRKYTLKTIKRDREWFNNSFPTLLRFWKKMQYYNLHGRELLISDINKGVSPDMKAANDPMSVEEIDLASVMELDSCDGNIDVISVPVVAYRSDNLGNMDVRNTPADLEAPKVIHTKNTNSDDVSGLDCAGGALIIPISALTAHINWDEWVGATAVRNYMLKDPLLDWLNIYGKGHRKKYTGFEKTVQYYEQDAKDASPFINHLKVKGIQFEDSVMHTIRKKFPNDVVTIANYYQARQADKLTATIAAMKAGVKVIYQGVLHNPHDKTYGIADLIVRSDFINELVSDVCDIEEHGCVFSTDWHYLIIDIKHSTLMLRADGVHLLNQGAALAYKAQILIYMRALNRIQKYNAVNAYILGRKWHYTTKSVKHEGFGWFDKLGTVNFSTTDIGVVHPTNKAIQWVRYVKSHGSTWSIDPPSRIELYPNMCNRSDAPWHNTKQKIAAKIGEITSMWYCGVESRNKAVRVGVKSWHDRKCTAELLGINGAKTGPTLNKILDINRSTKHTILPKYVSAPPKTGKVRFFLDFETVNSLAEDIQLDSPFTVPEQFIFMIGIGWTIDTDSNGVDLPKWHYKCLTTDFINEENEKKIFLEMHTLIKSVLRKYNAGNDFIIYHWSNAERTIYNKANERYNVVGGLNPHWYDLCKFFKNEPIVIKGAFNFGLKSITTAMNKLGLLSTSYATDGILDGLNAMVKAMECSAEAVRLGVSMKTMPVVQRIMEYNEIDCKVMMDILEYVLNNMVRKRRKSSRLQRGAKRCRLDK
jgi:putative phage-type endonuclease